MNYYTLLFAYGTTLLACCFYGGVFAADTPIIGPQQASKEAPWINSLGMKFVPVKDTEVLFCIWDTRVQDFTTFAKAAEGTAPVTGQELAKNWQSPFPGEWHTPKYQQSPLEPVCNVSWDEAKAFCRWLTQTEHAAGRLAADRQYRLPTDAEWSVAVGLGPEKGKTPHDKDSHIEIFPWGTQMLPPKGAGNYYGEEHRRNKYDTYLIAGYNDGFTLASPVGSFPANACGLYDVSGNVWQWCEDLFDPPLPARALRGAAWCTSDIYYLWSSRRIAVPPDDHYNYIGFRCVLAEGMTP